MRSIALLAVLLACAAPAAHAGDPLSAVPVVPHRVLERRPHDPTLYTQGMVFHGDQLLESGGGYGQSRLLLRSLERPEPVVQARLPMRWFGEGVAVIGGHAVVLSWQEGVAQEFSLPALQRTRQLRYRGEGWGLTSDGTQLIQSDGSAVLVWRDPVEFTEKRRLTVRAAGVPIERLNELEWVEGWILANVWYTDAVVLIDPRDGTVRGKLALEGLLSNQEAKRAETLNGIAWHAPSRTLWVSGKRWPWMFALKVDWPTPGMDTPAAR